MRPKIIPQEKLSSFIIIRVSEREKKDIQKQFRHERFSTLSDFARNRLLKKRLVKHITVSEEYFQVFRRLDYQLAKVGNNMNQVAHKLNAYNTYMLSEEDKMKIQECYQLHKEAVSVLSNYLKVIRL
ncbi:plasmid mobilization protein [Carboxylicivirga sp. N1Y90]|uniref:plasmid mobilization protein n=1 Tax=Carboxylicivirga fragile TaxID=3417571 RepID=UPI003D355E69|nr:plasmid mobilization relaxosome protein MobC [Marinilabiliaceae bacterium N1Y90]